MARRRLLRSCVLWVIPVIMLGQEGFHYQSDFLPDEFKARWGRMFDKIGDRAIAIVQGAPQVGGFIFPRQTNEFYYLCGIETPNSYILLDGRSRAVILFLPPRNQQLERAEGKVLSAADADLIRKLTGVDSVASTEAMAGSWMGSVLKDPSTAVYTPFAPSERNAENRYELDAANAGIASDYWDGRISREARFIELIRTRYPRNEVRNLTPILDELRSVKSSKEVGLIRRASQLAGMGIMEAMKSAKPGMYEFELDAAARYIFLVNGARLEGYRSITSSGTANIWNAHYYRNLSQLNDGDMVLLDYAPDYRYYVSDIARMFPVNGKFTNLQREILGFVLKYRNEVLKRIRPGVTPKEVMNDVKTAMEPILKATKFSKPIYEEAARKLVETGGGVFSHPVGMAVHDDGSYWPGPLKPGHVFSIDPSLWVPEEHLYYRYEDVIVITENGYENFTDFLPAEPTETEKLMKQEGIVQKVPPSSRPR